MTDAELLDRIEVIRARNNISWMGILRLAFQVAPEEARAIVRKIDAADAELKALSHELAHNAHWEP